METQTLMELVDIAEALNEPYEKTDENLQRAAELENLGFVQLAQDILKKVEAKDKRDRITRWGYLCITQEKIEQYLNKKVDLYDAMHPIKAKTVSPSHSDLWEWRPGMFTDPTLLSGRIQMEQALLTGQFFQTQGLGQFIEGPTSRLISDTVKRPICTIKSKPTCRFNSPDGGDIGRYTWTETPLDSYPTLPPEHILGILKEHQSRKVFDYFTIASVNAVRDPLLLGRINGTEDRFYIAQWGDDVALEDVL